MEPLSTRKQTIAWFTLAEHIANNQKERALGLYNLLSHSIDDHAFARQLKADLLCAFDFEHAAPTYDQAAQLYRQSNRTAHVVAIYEQLALRYPDHEAVLDKLVQAYLELGQGDRAAFMLRPIIESSVKAGRVHEISMALSQLHALLGDQEHAQLVTFFKNLSEQQST